MKKTLLAIFLTMAFSLTACTNTPPASAALNSADYILDVSYTPIYDNVEFSALSEMTGDGAPQNYEDLQDYIKIYDGKLTFVEYEIISQYSPEEAVRITGEDFFENSTTLYEAHIYYDYLNDSPLDLTVHLAKAGTPAQQFENDPPYVVGQKLVSPIIGIGSSWCIASPELVFYVYDVNGVALAYHVDNEEIRFTDNKHPNLNMKLADKERSVITTTSNNPVLFTQKSTVEDLTEFIRQDWTKRGYEFFDFQNISAGLSLKNNTPEQVPYDQMIAGDGHIFIRSGKVIG